MQASTTPIPPQIEAAMRSSYHIARHRESWDDVLPGLEELAGQHADRDWTIESVRAMLDEDLAFLLVDDDDPTAFAVVRFDQYPYGADETELFVFLVWHQGGEAIARFQPHLEMFARTGGARFMRFYSRRPAFLRVAQRAGYELRGIEYVKELHHGR